MNYAVVVPTIREHSIKRFCEAWEMELRRPDVVVYVCEDNADKTFELPKWIQHLCWKDAEGKDCIPTRSGGFRDIGFLRAYQDGARIIISLDDDVLPPEGMSFLASHQAMLNAHRMTRWQTVVPMYHTRGFPLGIRSGVETMINHGLWEGVPDVDAVTQLSDGQFQQDFDTVMKLAMSTMTIPYRSYFPQCIMNVAFKREITPAMYMAKLPDGMKRWDDIWCGIFAKRICDLNNWAVASGEPHVRHQRASDPLNNLKQEMLGYGYNEVLWEVVDGIEATGNVVEQYYVIAETIHRQIRGLQEMTTNMMDWCELWR